MAPSLSDPDIATAFVRRVFSEIFTDLSPSSFARAREVLNERFVQHSDGRVIDRQTFLNLMQSNKARLASQPRFTWSDLVATGPREGLVHVTSVHSVALHLRDGSRLNQKVVALIQIDVESGTILRCDELTRVESSRDRMPVKSPRGTPFETSIDASDPPTIPARHRQQRRIGQDSIGGLPADVVAEVAAAAPLLETGLHPATSVDPLKVGVGRASHDSTMTAFEAEFAAAAH